MTQRHLFFTWQRFFEAALVLAALRGYAAEPEQRAVRMGFVHPQSPSTASGGINAFWKRLHELGYVEGQNLLIEARWAEGHYDRLPALMTEVLARKVDVLVIYGAPGAAAAKNATSAIPIVGVAMGDPLRTGLVTSLARPEGNLTGLSVGWGEGIAGKWLELLQETVPRLLTVAVIGNPNNPIDIELAKELEALAPTRRLKLRHIEVRDSGALNRAFEQARRMAQAVLVLPDSILSAHRGEVTALAAKHRVPTMYSLRDFVDAGGLMAYSPDYAVQWWRAADYVDKILKGAKPAELPVEQPTQYLLVVNLKTARALRLRIPESILLRAEAIR
jgi:putative ABC transport system substrate-binding protein